MAGGSTSTANARPWVTLDSGIQFITNGSHKYVYYPGTGKEQFFDLQTDRGGMTALIYNPSYEDAVSAYRTHLINELQTRPEGFVHNGVLARVGGPTPSYLLGYEWRG